VVFEQVNVQVKQRETSTLKSRGDTIVIETLGVRP